MSALLPLQLALVLGAIASVVIIVVTILKGWGK